MTTPDTSPRCPRCGKPSGTPSGYRAYYCHNCRQDFDDQDDGTVGYGDPARNAERRERQRIAEKERKADGARAKLKGGLGR